MTIKDLLYVSYQNFRNRKSRVFFTVLGVAVAIAVVLTLVSFGYGLQRNLLNQITTEDALLTLDVFPTDSKVIQLTDASLGKIAHTSGVDKVSPEATLDGQILYDGVIADASINIVRPDFFSLDGKNPVAGRFFSDADHHSIVISSDVADLFDVPRDQIIDKKIQIKTRVAMPDKPDQTTVVEDTYTVLGVIEGRTGSGEVYLDQSDSPTMQVPTYTMTKVKVVSQNDIENVRSKLIDMGYIVSALSDVVSQANKIFRAVQVALGIFGTFALIVAAIGLVNTMTISLLERTNEIGIMRAIGAAPGDIRKIFLGESILIGFLGGISGIFLGVVASELLNWLFDLLSQALGGAPARLFAYPLWFILFIILLSTFVGLIGGIWPAERAARMNPLLALRYK